MLLLIAPARNRERLLFHWRKIQKRLNSSRVDGLRRQRLGKIYPGTPRIRTPQGHTVFIDFTAAWCITCKFNEATVLETAAVREPFRAANRETKSRLDERRSGDYEIIKTIWPAGCPTLCALSGRHGATYVFPELLTKNIVLEKLETINRNIASQ